ncbi:MAG: D-2-hydroxyacid dehydrogenase [Chloroflexi bacterium]|nr:D-2-hydroxyacid dehydrogenase [Chloroflexota bacterium]
MHKLLLLTKDKDREAYGRYLRAAALPELEIASSSMPDIDLVFGEPNLIREVLPDLPALRWAQATWAGVDPLLDPSLRRDYILTNARGVFGGLMSEYVFGYLLMHERKILQRLAAQKQSRWEPSLTGTLRGKTIGLLGVGSIGAHLAESAQHFGMRVHGYTRNSETSPQVDRYYHGAELLSFASQLDVLVSTLPNTNETRKIVSASLLEALPEQAIFINAGRGSAVDEAALIDALKRGRLAGAVLDVFEQEPLPAEHPFWQTKNLFITSHTAAPSFPQDIASLFIDNYRAYIEGKPLKYQVSFELGY